MSKLDKITFAWMHQSEGANNHSLQFPEICTQQQETEIIIPSSTTTIHPHTRSNHLTNPPAQSINQSISPPSKMVYLSSAFEQVKLDFHKLKIKHHRRAASGLSPPNPVTLVTFRPHRYDFAYRSHGGSSLIGCKWLCINDEERWSGG